MSRERRLVAAIGMLLAVVVTGTVGYVVVEGAGAFDSLYMVIITISTVGFKEVFALSTAGRVLTIALLVIGIGALLYTAVTTFEIMVERLLGGEVRRRRMTRQIETLRDHVVLCGFGRVGSTVWRRLRAEQTPTVIVEVDPEAAAAGRATGALVVEGDATRNDVLEAAGVDRARALVACVRNDNDNLVIVLSAKHRRRDLTVIARATELEAEEKLRLAGADRVVSPQLVGAHRLAALATDPGLDEIVDVVFRGRMMELRIEELTVGTRSSLAGVALRDSAIRELSGCLVLAVETGAGELRFNPDPGERLHPGQAVIVIGSHDQVENLKARFESS